MGATFKGPDGVMYTVEKVMEIAGVNRECAKARIRTANRTGRFERLIAVKNAFKNKSKIDYDIKYVKEELTEDQKQTLSKMVMASRVVELLNKYFPAGN